MNTNRRYGVVFMIIGVFLPLISLMFTSGWSQRLEYGGRHKKKTNFGDLRIIFRDAVIRSDDEIFRIWYDDQNKTGEKPSLTYQFIVREEDIKASHPPAWVQDLKIAKREIALPYKYILVIGTITFAIGLGLFILNRKECGHIKL